MSESMDTDGVDLRDDARFALRDDLVVEEIDDEFLILDLAHNTYFGLNGVARRIWEEVQAGRTFKGIVDAICAEYEVSRREAAKDVEEFIMKILDQGLATELA